MSSTNSRIAKANQILDRAEKMLLGGMSKQQALDIMSKCWNGLSFALGNTDNPLENALKNEADIVNQINKANKGNIRAVKLGNGAFGLVVGAGNAMINDLNGEDTIEKIIDMGANVALSIWNLTPTGKFVNFANFLVSELTGYDLTTPLKNIYKNLIGENVDLKNTRITPDGFLETIVDGTVYARPFMPNAQGSLFGNGKSDVLFGGSGNDMLIGHAGSDILIGGAGKDDYFVDNGDTIIDSDGKGRVFLSSTNIQLTGGKQTEKGSNIYMGDDGVKYEISGYNLIINDNITIENFSKISNDLGIVLVDVDDIVVTIGNNQSTEGGNGKHSMEFKITLNRALKKDEFLELIINGQRIKFKEGDIEQTYTHTWDGNTIKEEDRKFEVSGIVMQTSENLNVQAVVSGQGLIKDDDQDNDPDPEREASPIVIDLGNDGINSHALNYTINFDLDNNGFKEATGWVSGDDALLAIDKNNNGMIDNGSELFGNKSISDSAFSYTNSSLNNGFETLKSYDTNNDDIIDSQDAEFDKLLLWQDKNGNAITDNGELIKLSDKVSSINLNYTNTNINNNDNTIRQTSTATLNDGTKVKADDIWFKVNYKDTEEIIDENEIPFEIKALPNVKAFGNIHSLHYAMANNETLATMMNLYLIMDSETRKENINTLISEWAGVSDIDENAGRGDADARKVAVYEILTGKPFLQRGSYSEPGYNASAMIEDYYNKFSNFVYATIELNTTYSYLNLDFEILKFDENLGKYNYDFSNLNLRIQTLYNENKLDELKNLSNIIRTSLTYKPFANSLLKENYINNFKDNKELLSLLSGTFVIGTANNDTLNGTNEADYLNGLGGNDNLYGGYGNDIYEFNGDFGSDTIYDTAGKDSIYLDINSDRISLKRELANLIIQTKDEAGEPTGNKITIQNYFNINPEFGNGVIENIKFLDGATWSVSEILANAPLNATDGSDKFYLTDGDDKINALNGDDTIYGGNGNDTINGDDGNDILYGDNGDDTLIGGAGNDTLNGGNGDDTYIFNIGDGNDTISDSYGSDTIKFGEGISKDDLIIKKTDYYSLKIGFKNNSTDSITLNGLNIENFEFANGDKLSLAHIQALPLYASDESETIYGYNDKANIINALGGDDSVYGGNRADTLYGGSGNDSIYGGYGDDTITGGTGNDNLQGGYGNDTYIFSKGDGVDTIIDAAGSDTIKFNDFNQDDIELKRELASLIITSKISDDKITIQNFFDTNTNNPIEKIIFKDSSEWNLNEILKNAPLLGTDGDDKFYLTSNDDEFDALSGDDIIHAGNGNDTINGGNGNDTIYAGNGDDNVGGDDGDDTLYGDDGNDTLIGGKGNDTLNGGNGDDTYIYNLGDGVDTITEKNGNDTIKFGEGINKEDLIVQRVNSNGEINTTSNLTDIKISFKSSPNDSVILKSVVDANVTNSSNAIENFEFKNGDKLSFDDIKKLSLKNKVSNDEFKGYNDIENAITGLDSSDIINGGELSDSLYGNGGDDKIYSYGGDDTIDLGDGNDTVYAGYGNDTIIGGRGDDILKGEYGSDTYIYNLGDGNDTISEQGNYYQDDTDVDTLIFGQGIKKEDLLVFRKPYDLNLDNDDSQDDFNQIDRNLVNLVIKFKNSPSDSITIENAISDGKIDTNNTLKAFKFANGDELNIDDIANLAMKGSDTDDIIYAFKNENFIINAGKGNDIIYGSTNNEIYEFGLGDGNDTIIKRDLNNPNLIVSDSYDIIRFKDGVNKDDIKFYFDGDDLLIKNEKSNDSIRVKRYFSASNDTYKINKIEFANGEFLTSNDIDNLAIKFGTNEKDSIYGYKDANDHIFALNADDSVFGFGGDDYIDGGDGNDYLSGGNGMQMDSGNDTLIGGNGDDTLRGEDGDDTLIGGSGNNKYIYESGNDTIILSKGANDILFLQNDVNKDDLILSTNASKQDLIIKFKNSDKNSIVVKDYFTYKNLRIQPSKGYLISYAQIKSMLKNTPTTSPNTHDNQADNLGNNPNIPSDNPENPQNNNQDNLTPQSGTIKGDNNTNDTLYGDGSDNVFVFTKGQDTIIDQGGYDKLIFKDGINFSQIGNHIMSNGQDLIFRLNGSSDDEVTIKDFFNNPSAIIEEFVFETGGSISAAQIYSLFGLEIPQNIKKTDPTKLTYQDINLNHQNNTLTISGGNYSISDKGGRDTIILSGYNKEDISFQKIANDLSIKYGDDNYLMIRNQSNKNNAIETIKIEQSDGTTKFITSTQINKIIEQLNTYANDNGLTSITHDDIASNQNLMQLVMSGWGN